MRDLRPTSNKVLQALFNILYSVRGKIFLDLFAGTGQVGLTALKKGTDFVVFVEIEKYRSKKIEIECEKFGFSERFKVYSVDVLYFLKKEKDQVYDIVFADPPYNYRSYDKLIEDCLRVLKKDGIFILEHRSSGGFHSYKELVYDERVYDDTKLTFWRKV
ncbi:MAG: RsmD family RNA methyltransferase [Hydrogenothermaceae bacterium]|nr:RsmD family RNA methyltransferase [Hydrogenothermaceae bacterium]